MPLFLVGASRALAFLRLVLVTFGRPAGLVPRCSIVTLVVGFTGDRKPPPLLRRLGEITIVASVGAMRRGGIRVNGNDRANRKDAVGDVWAQRINWRATILCIVCARP